MLQPAVEVLIVNIELALLARIVQPALYNFGLCDIMFIQLYRK